MFVVIELQKVNDEQIANIVNAYSSKETAERQYHTVLAAAAVSALPCHSAVMLDDHGRMIKCECYVHEVVEQNE